MCRRTEELDFKIYLINLNSHMWLLATLDPFKVKAYVDFIFIFHCLVVLTAA